MTRADYLDSMQATSSRTFTSLLMSAFRTADIDQRNRLRKAFPVIASEFQYRFWCGGGYMPGEEGYDPVTDDNLKVARDGL